MTVNCYGRLIINKDFKLHHLQYKKMKARLKAKKSDLSNVDQLMLIWKISRGCFSYWLLNGVPWAWTQCLIHFELCLICSFIIWYLKDSPKQMILNQEHLLFPRCILSNLMTSPKILTIFPTLNITLFYDQHSNQISLNFLLPECSTLVPKIATFVSSKACLNTPISIPI